MQWRLYLQVASDPEAGFWEEDSTSIEEVGSASVDWEAMSVSIAVEGV